jgi:hypothetical protein
MKIEQKINTIKNRIELLFSQTLSNWKLLLLCNNTKYKEDYNQLQELYDNNCNILFHNEKTMNMASTLNIGVHTFLENNYSHMLLVSCHDKFYPNFLKFLLEKNKNFVYESFHRRKESKHPITKYNSLRDLIYNYNGLCNTMWSKSSIQRIGLFDENKEYAAVYDYYLKTFMVLKETQIGYVNIALNTCLCEFNKNTVVENNVNILIDHCKQYSDKITLEQLQNIIILEPKSSALNNVNSNISKKKLYYKLNLYDGCKVQLLLNNTQQCIIEYNKKNVTVNDKLLNTTNCILTLWFNDNQYEIYINGKHIINIVDYDNILLSTINTEYYKMSINYPLSISNFSIDNYRNLNYLFSTFSHLNEYQINILHTDYLDENRKKINEINEKILHYNCNYIYVKTSNKTFFNLGYTRNLYKYLSFSHNIMISDTDIVIPKYIYINMYKKTMENYDIIKPYSNKLVYTTIREKNNWLNNYTYDDDQYKQFITTLSPSERFFTLSGGIILFKKHILEKIGGYNEVNSYGHEDRMMDVHILSDSKIKIYNFDYIMFHLYHQRYYALRNKLVISFNRQYYNCVTTGKKDNLHNNCQHKTKWLEKIEEFNRTHNGNLKLFENIEERLKYATLKPELFNEEKYKN